MKVFGFNIDSFIYSYMPPYLRRHETVFMLYQVLLYPLQYIMAKFVQKQNSINKQIRYNNQVIYLEQCLNDIFNPGHNGIFDSANNNIYIADLVIEATVYEFMEYELSEYDPYSHQEAEITDMSPYLMQEDEDITNIHYVVNIPAALALNGDDVTGLINKYNPLGRIYQLEPY